MLTSRGVFWGRSRQVLCVIIVAICAAHRGLGAEETSDSAQANELYHRAIQLRVKRDASNRDLRRAYDMLLDAAGVVIDDSMASRTSDAGADVDSLTGEDGEASQVVFSNDTHIGALKELADIFETGFGGPFNPTVAYQLIHRAASLGDAGAQADVGFRLALGLRLPTRSGSNALFSLAKPATADALLHYYFAAGANDTFAQMVLGYRHMYGLGVPRSCQAAVLYYNPVAEQVIELARHPGRLPQLEWIRLEDAAVLRGQPSRDQEVLHFQWFADLGHPDAQRRVGLLLSQGGAQDPQQALHYFLRAAEGGDDKAMAHLGHMYANGMGVDANNETALFWFQKAADKGNPSALYGLGYLHLAGYGIPKNPGKALDHFNQAAKQGNIEARFHLGVMHLNGWGVELNPQLAKGYFTIAAKDKHLLAMYNLAMMHLSSSDPGHCAPALELLKQVAERGPMVTLLTDAYDEFEEGNYEAALILYLKAAEVGFELAQSNAAWMLQHGKGVASEGAAPLALLLHQRAASQGNVAALLKLGDSAWYGRGAPRDWRLAAQLYAHAAKLGKAQAVGDAQAARMGAQATFNLGFMHQFGAGLPADFALAKRYYDTAGESTMNPWLPVALALFGLGLHERWLKLRPSLPAWGNPLWDRVFVVRDDGPTHEPLVPANPGGATNFGLGLGWLEKLVDALWSGEGDSADGGSTWDNMETILLLAMCCGLWLILWRRRSLRQQAWQGQPPAVAGGAARRPPHGLPRGGPAPAPVGPAAGAAPAGGAPAPAAPDGGADGGADGQGSPPAGPAGPSTPPQ